MPEPTLNVYQYAIARAYKQLLDQELSGADSPSSRFRAIEFLKREVERIANKKQGGVKVYEISSHFERSGKFDDRTPEADLRAGETSD